MEKKVFRKLALSYPKGSELLAQEFEKMLKGRKSNIAATKRFLQGYVSPVSKKAKANSSRTAVAALAPTSR
jgi:hypothetical protein